MLHSQPQRFIAPPRRGSRQRLRSAAGRAVQLESLELRQLLCFDSINSLLPARVLAMFDDSGHIKASQYAKLNHEQQALIGLHQVEDDRPEAEQLAELNRDKPGSGSGDGLYALPDLVPIVGGTYGALQPFVDKTEQPGRNLLRFTTAVGNQGEGPVTLFSGTTSEYVMSDGTQLVKQRLFNYNNNAFTAGSNDVRDAGRFVYHPTHGHFHFENYARYRLLTTAGEQVYRSDGTAAIGDKVGFCLINIASSFTTTAGTSSTSLPGYNGTGQPSTGCGFLQGISVGRADVYDSQYDGQWIDVTGVPNGNYKLEVTLDAGNAVMETNETNNTVTVPYTLNTTAATGGTIALDRFETPTPNNDFAHATDLGEQGTSNYAGLTMHADADADYFKFTAASSGTYNVGLVVADRLVDVYLYDSTFHELGRNTTPTMGSSSSPVTKNISYTFTAGQTYYVRAEGFSGSGTGGDTGGLSNNYTLKLAVNPTVRSSAPLATAGEDALAEGSIRIARNGPSSSALAVNFTVGGTATRGVDYDLMYNGSVFSGNTMTIGVESLGETLRVVPRADSIVEATETVVLTLTSNSAYVVGSDAPSATVSIADAAPRVTASAFSPTTNTVRFDFSLDVSASLTASDLLLTDAATGLATTVAASGVAYDAATNRATFTLDGVLPAGSYVAKLAAARVTHALGAPLAADAVVNFTYLPGDADLSGTVDFADLLALAQHFGASGTFSQGDVNYDGIVNFDDLLVMSQNYAAAPGVVTSATPASHKPRSTRLADSVLA